MQVLVVVVIVNAISHGEQPLQFQPKSDVRCMLCLAHCTSTLQMCLRLIKSVKTCLGMPYTGVKGEFEVVGFTTLTYVLVLVGTYGASYPLHSQLDQDSLPMVRASWRLNHQTILA